MHCDDKGKKRMKKAVGSVAKKAAEGADSLLSEARKDVVAARNPKPAVEKETAEMAEAVSKVTDSAESMAKGESETNMQETVALINSFDFSGGNKKMDKAYIMESLSAVQDSNITTSKESIAEFITDLHETQMDEENKPLLSQKDFKKLTTFAANEPREGKMLGGVLIDLAKHGEQFFSEEGDSESIFQKIKGTGQQKEASISNLEGADPIEPTNNTPKIGYAEGGDVEEYAEGGEANEDDMPTDTYDNIPEDEKKEVEESQLPDDVIEKEYSEFVLKEALSDEDQDYLSELLGQNDQLRSIFYKIMDTAGEFAGEGAVEGPGDGTSDSIPARLSDGEFVFTKKAVDVIGADKLQEMMDDAERDYDEDREGKYEGGMMDSLLDGKDYDEEVHNQMLSANAMPSVRKR
jgi:hypothetical protein